MKKMILAAGIAAFSLLIPDSASGVKTIQYPWINYANGTILDVSQVELTDTATVLNINARFRPKNWIIIDTGSSLKADGKEYPLKGAVGIKPGERFWMPESGEADFTLIFEPLPENTLTFDFSEGDFEDAFKLGGIDISGKPIPDYPEGVPADMKTEFKDGSVPSPAYEIGEITVNFRLSPFQKEMKQLVLYVNSFPGGQESYTLNFNDAGEASVKFEQYGTADAYVMQPGLYRMLARLTLRPGETVDCVIDSRISGVAAMDHRKGFDHKYKLGIHNGHYRNFDAMRDIWCSGAYPYSFAPQLFDYKMTGDAYKAKVKNLYSSYIESISKSDMPVMAKEFFTLSVQDNVLRNIADYRWILQQAYMNEKKSWSSRPPQDSIPAQLTDKDFEEMCEWFDIDNEKLFMVGGALAAQDWNAYGVKGDLSKSAEMYLRMTEKVKEQKLTSADIDSLKTLSNPFYAEAIQSLAKSYNEKIEQLRSKATVTPTPEVADSEIFDAIIAPHKRKVVMVDLWNTWCGPCRAAIKRTEPLKENELSDEDIVWIYIADESSDAVKYLEMLPGIKGIHYKLNMDQIKLIRERFNVDGIPYYILVDREGNAEGRPDLRDHNKYIGEIKAKLQK